MSDAGATEPGNLGPATTGITTSFHAEELTIGPPIPLKTNPFNPEPRREKIRAWLALGLVFAFLLLTFGLVLAVVCERLDMASAKDLATIALTPLFGLTSTAVGFYYAGSKG